MVSSRLLMLLPVVLIAACHSSSLAFLMMCSVYKLSKQHDNKQSCHTPFSILNQFFHTGFCCFLTSIQVSQETRKMVWYSHLFKSFPQFIMIHTVKGFSVLNETEVDVFLEFSCFLCDPANVGNLISDSSAFAKSSWYI